MNQIWGVFQNKTTNKMLLLTLLKYFLETYNFFPIFLDNIATKSFQNRLKELWDIMILKINYGWRKSFSTDM